MMVKFDLQTNYIPVDTVAARVISKGFSEEYVNRGCGAFSTTPFVTKRIDWNMLKLKGEKVGYLTVIGPLDDGERKYKKSQWSCRCVCGNYVLRTAKAIRNLKNSGDRCDECRELFYRKRTDHYRNHGFDSVEMHE